MSTPKVCAVPGPVPEGAPENLGAARHFLVSDLCTCERGDDVALGLRHLNRRSASG